MDLANSQKHQLEFGPTKNVKTILSLFHPDSRKNLPCRSQKVQMAIEVRQNEGKNVFINKINQYLKFVIL